MLTWTRCWCLACAGSQRSLSLRCAASAWWRWSTRCWRGREPGWLMPPVLAPLPACCCLQASPVVPAHRQAPQRALSSSFAPCCSHCWVPQPQSGQQDGSTDCDTAPALARHLASRMLQLSNGSGVGDQCRLPTEAHRRSSPRPPNRDVVAFARPVVGGIGGGHWTHETCDICLFRQWLLPRPLAGFRRCEGPVDGGAFDVEEGKLKAGAFAQSKMFVRWSFDFRRLPTVAAPSAQSLQLEAWSKIIVKP